jgi:LysM repeat protein
LLAPISLVAFAVIFLIVIVSSLDGGSESGNARTAQERTAKRSSEARRSRATRTSGTTGATGATGAAGSRRVYVVKSGDTLVKIASSTGVPIEELLSLNPSIDPQGLVTGQRVKLRE